MNPRTTGLLALVALVLGAFVYFYEIEGETGRETEREAEKQIFAGLEADSIESLELTTSDGITARFERREGDWRVVSPIEGAGDATALDAITSALAGLARAGSVASAPGDLAQFGLGDAARIVRFEAKGASHALAVGRPTPVGGNVYVRADEADEVAYVESYRLNALKHGLTELRDRRIVRLAPEALARLVIAWPEAESTTAVELERDASEVWQIRRPIAARADQQTVRELISNLEYLQATGFLDERTVAVEAALKETALELRLTERGAEDSRAEGAAEASGSGAPQASDEEATRSIRIAGLEGGSRIVESEGRLYRLAPERLEDFVRERDAYRDRQLVDLAPGALERIELAFAGGDPIVLRRGDAGWSGEGREIEPDAVSSLADTLATLRAEQIVADEMGAAELASIGLEPVAARFLLKSADESGAAIGIELGRLDPARGLFARRTGESVVYALAASLAEALPLDLATFDERYGRRPEPEPEAEAEAEAEPSAGSASGSSAAGEACEAD
ncbi:MAG: DUF4340 domain-containing protein [Deltaproteobacteria bacterium]|nr:DUF4340 domain-containing protein [Deltaproteobacteria bacterium]